MTVEQTTEGAEGQDPNASPEANASEQPGDQQEGSEQREGSDQQGSSDQQEGSEQQGDNPWRDSIPEEHRKLADRYTSPAEVVKALAETQKNLHSRIKVPGEDASDEDRAKFRKALGVPDEPTGYEAVTVKPEHLPDEEFQSEEMQGALKEFSEVLHKADASADLAKAVLDWYWTTDAGAKRAQKEAEENFFAQAETALRKEWGESYDAEEAVARDYILSKGLFQLAETKIDGGDKIGNHPAFIKAMAEAGRLTSEGEMQFGIHGTEAATNMETRHNELTEEIQTALSKGNTALAQRLQGEREELSKKLFGSKPISGAAL